MSVTINYKVYGEGEPVIILHGLFGTLDNWQTFAKRLAEHYMVYVIDQRDHGKSSHTDEFNYQLLADDLATFMESQWIHEARLIGHSMGGKTVMQFAEDHTDMVEQMVVVDIAPVAYEPGHNTIFEALLAVNIDKVESRGEVEAVLGQYIADQGVRLFLMKNLKRKKEGGFEWKMNLPLLHREYPNIISNVAGDAEVDVDCLFVGGGKSKYIDKNASDTIAKKYSNSKLVMIPEAGHWIHAEQPDKLYQLVTEYFDGN